MILAVTDAMRPLAGERLLAAWEAGASEYDLSRALTMLATAMPGTDRAQLGALPIADLNRLLLRLHELTFGPELQVFGACSACGAQFEFAVPTRQLTGSGSGQSPAGQVNWDEQGRRYTLRAVTADDLLATLGTPEASAAQDLLLARCLEVSPAAGPGPGPAGARERFEQLNAASELSCAVGCPGCSSREILDLDIARFLWTEVRTAARRLLGEIHQLASAYGWSEQAIAAMGAGRRRAYLEMLSA